MITRACDVAVVGGGVVGLATALRLLQHARVDLAVLEAEDRVAAHQTGHNSGVVHSGIYYKPGSLKAKLCVEGREALYAFCAERGVRHEKCGKVIVAATPEELPRLDAIEQRGKENGLDGLRRLDPAALKAIEPHATGLAALHVPQTGIVDYREVSEALAAAIREQGGAVETRAEVEAVRREAGRFVLDTPGGEVRCRFLVNCAGLRSDRFARLAGVEPGLRIVPFRGEYWSLAPDRAHLVKHLIYPVPDPRYPFLGVHFTRRISGEIEAGPNAVLAFKREGYTRFSMSARDLWDTFSYPGAWRLFAKHWRTGVDEWTRSLSKAALVRALQVLVPEVRSADVVAAGSGVRAQAVGPDGAMVDDFHIVEAENQVHVLNAPSPAATACLAIGRVIAETAVKRFGLG
jgi:L-2-hydroxyglutarate oxidase